MPRVGAEAAFAIVRALEESLLGVTWSDRGDLADWWGRADLERDSWALEEDGTLLAFGWIQRWPEAASGTGFVHPDARGRGLGTLLAERAEQRARELGSDRLREWTYAADAAARRLFESRGYREVRRFREMTIELADAPPVPALPPGLRVDTFREDDARAFHAAAHEAFADDWTFQPTPFDEWWEMRSRASSFDPSLWFVVRDGAEIAAIARCEANRRGGGYIGLLGVRKPWRRRGLGLALLRHAFGEFRRRGAERVSLGVDCENATGATRLYERAGMHVEVESVVFEVDLA